MSKQNSALILDTSHAQIVGFYQVKDQHIDFFVIFHVQTNEGFSLMYQNVERKSVVIGSLMTVVNHCLHTHISTVGLRPVSWLQDCYTKVESRYEVTQRMLQH